MFEHRQQPLISRKEFLRRQVIFTLIALGLILLSLLIGIAGYHFLGRLTWIDALLNASMIMSGMGPVDTLHTVAIKIFASFYALYSGVVFLVSAGVLFAPLIHRIFHHFHLESGTND
jgi:hypothetical protein